MYELKNLYHQDFNKQISDEEANKIIYHIKFLGKHMHTYCFFQIVKRNLRALLTFIKESQNLFVKADSLECNRLLYNFADSFYAYINFFDSNYKDAFEGIKKDFFENRFEYAFIYKLRNYMIHEDLPIFKQEREFGKNDFKRRFIISKNKLFASTTITENIRVKISNNYLETEDIDIMPILEKLKRTTIDIQLQILNKLSERLIDSFKFLMHYIKNGEEVYIFNDKKVRYGLLNVTTKYYKSMAENFVYDENLLSEPDVNNFFMKISYLYFGEKNKFYKMDKTVV